MELNDALSEEKITGLIRDLKRHLDSLDSEFSEDAYEEEVQNEFWRTITGQREPDNEIEYQSLPEDAKRLIGHNEYGELPWWFEAFEWTFRGVGNGILTVGDDDLQELESYDPQNTLVKKPELARASGDWISLLKSLDELRDELISQTNFDESDLHLSPDEYESFDGHIFELESGSIRTTEDFREWVESVLEFCPPHNPTTTALLRFNTGLPVKGMKGFLEDKFDLLERTGLVSDGVVQNETYREAFTEIMSFTKAFDFAVEATSSYPNSLLESGATRVSGLERLYIDSWADNAKPLDEGGRRVLELAGKSSPSSLDESEAESFAKYTLTTPVYFETSKWDHFRHVGFDTHHRNERGGFDSPSGKDYEQEKRAYQILRVLREHYDLLSGEDDD